MRSPVRLSDQPSAGVRAPAWRIGVLLLLPVLGYGAEEQGPAPRSIIGGQAATVQSYPFVVYVQLPDNRNCTGSIIAPSWVLTAAHCVVGPSGTHASMRIWHGYGADFTVTYVDSKRIIPHPKYKYAFTTAVSRPYDIALIEVAKPFPVSYSAPLSLARTSAETRHAPSGTSAVIVGYGWMTNTQPSRGMRSASTPLYYPSACHDQFEFPNEAQVAHKDTVCAGTTTKRGHYGDSGGPLIVGYSGDGGKRWLQVGVANRGTSQSHNSETPHVTVVYARVSSYADWIQKTTNGAAVPLRVPATDDAPDPESRERLTIRLSQVQKQIESVQANVQSLQSVRNQLKLSIDQLKDAEGKDKRQQTAEDGLLGSVSTVLAQ